MLVENLRNEKMKTFADMWIVYPQGIANSASQPPLAWPGVHVKMSRPVPEIVHSSRSDRQSVLPFFQEEVTLCHPPSFHIISEVIKQTDQFVFAKVSYALSL